MTGIELLKNQLTLQGFNPSKVNANSALIEAVVSIVANNPEADIAMSMAKQKIADAENKLYKANEKRNEAAALERDAARKADYAREQAEEAKEWNSEAVRNLNENKKVLAEIQECLKVETAEARDKVRLFELFKQNLPKDCKNNQNAIIYSMGAILGNGMKAGEQK